MKIGFISINDPKDMGVWSGIKFSMYNILQKDHEIEWVGPIHADLLKFFHYWKSRLQKKKFIKQKIDWFHSISFSNSLGKKIIKKISSGYDVLFAPGASTEIAFLKTDIPIIYLSGTTFGAMLDYYDSFSNLTKRSIEEGHLVEKNALDRAQQIIFASTWALNSAKEIYHINDKKLHLLQYGPNLQKILNRDDLTYEMQDSIRLLFIGKEWNRKGGDIAVETFHTLKKMGGRVCLTIVGSNPSHINDPDIHIIPSINKQDPKELKQLYDIYLNNDFFLLPTRAECAGVVFSEAASFGLPILAADTGGVPDYVKNDINGFCLPLQARGADYAKIIHSVYNDEKRLRDLRKSSREWYEEKLNWLRWLDGFNSILREV